MQMKALLLAVASGLLALPLGAAYKAPVTATVSDTNGAMRAAWPPETLSGKISMVDPAQKLVVIQTPDGTPYDIIVTGRTRIESGDQRVGVQDLSGYTNKTVSVRFTPESRGDVASSMNLGG